MDDDILQINWNDLAYRELSPDELLRFREGMCPFFKKEREFNKTPARANAELQKISEALQKATETIARFAQENPIDAQIIADEELWKIKMDLKYAQRALELSNMNPIDRAKAIQEDKDNSPHSPGITGEEATAKHEAEYEQNRIKWHKIKRAEEAFEVFCGEDNYFEFIRYTLSHY